jgi:hypothetical protein
MRRISCLCLAATSVAALLFLAAPVSAQHVSACGDQFVSATIAGKHRCLQRGVACRSRLNAGYHRYLFDCRNGYLVYWWRGLLARPLHIPTLAAATPCPADAPTGGSDAYGGTRFGPGPAYPTLGLRDGHAALTYLRGWGYEGWDGAKVLWTVPSYRGPYIVRGRQLDGPGVLRFDQGPSWTNRLHDELRLTGPYADLNPAATFLRAPGCYAYQVDGRGFSYLIVFSAQPAA